MQLYQSKMAENFKSKYTKNIFNSFYITLLSFILVEIVTVILFYVNNYFKILTVLTMGVSALLGVLVVVKVKRTTIKEYILSLFTIMTTTLLLFCFFAVINSLAFGADGYLLYVAVSLYSTITFYLLCISAFIITSTITISKNIKNQDQNKLY